MSNHSNVIAGFESCSIPTLPAHDVGGSAFDIPCANSSGVRGAGIHFDNDVRVRILPAVLHDCSFVTDIFRQLEHRERVVPERRDCD